MSESSVTDNDPLSTPPDFARPIELKPAAFERPRLLATASELDALRARLDAPVESQMLERLRAHCARYMGRGLPEPGEPIDGRGVSQAQPMLALAFRLSGEKAYLEQARAHALALARCIRRFKRGRDLGASHALTSLAYAYDFLHDEFSEGERAAILDFVREFGAEYLSQTLIPVNYWGGLLMQNHGQVAFTAAGAAGLGFHEEIPQAKAWAEHAQRVYRVIAWLQLPDGTNIEGCSYGGYGNERMVLHYEAAKRCLGEDLYGPAERERITWYLHLSLPTLRPELNAFNWGDNAPRYDVHGPVHVLLAYARAFKDPLAQGLALECWRRRIGIDNLAWLDLLVYDPEVPEGNFGAEALAHHFEDLGLVCARSAWKDEQATAVSFQCGPFQGRRLMAHFSGDLGGAHCHADTASVQFFSRGEFLLADPGYEHVKRTHHHNTVLVGGHGQLGEGIKWFNVNRVLHYNGWAEILAFRDDGAAVSWIGDGTRMYVPEAKLKRFRRHALYARPDLLVVLDELEAEDAMVFAQLWHARGEFKPWGGGVWGFAQGQASLAVLPLEWPRGAPEVSCRLKSLTELKREHDCEFYELRAESPRASLWNFVTVFAAGEADRPPTLRAEVHYPEVRIVSSAGSGVARFSPQDASAPEWAPGEPVLSAAEPESALPDGMSEQAALFTKEPEPTLHDPAQNDPPEQPRPDGDA